MKAAFVLLGAAGFLVAGALVAPLHFRGGPPAQALPSPSSTPRSAGTQAPQAGAAACDEEDLRSWAGSVELKAMGQALGQLGSLEDADRRSAAQQALLSSWAERDLAGLAAWFCGRCAADEIHQQARDTLAQAFVQCNPDAVLAWMEDGLPEPARQELEDAFCRAWARAEPDAAAAKLQELAGASPDDSPWGDRLGQAASLWAGMDVGRAVSWAQSLEDGAAKTTVLRAVGYRWTEIHPQAAAACAAQQDDAILLELVAGKWAEADPRAAAAWAQGLPAGEARDQAILAAERGTSDGS